MKKIKEIICNQCKHNIESAKGQGAVIDICKDCNWETLSKYLQDELENTRSYWDNAKIKKLVREN